MALLEEDYLLINSLIDQKITALSDRMLQLDKSNRKTRIFDLQDYGFDEHTFDNNRYFCLESKLMDDISVAFFSNIYIILRYKDIYWTLNNYQNFHDVSRVFSFISVGTDQEINNIDQYEFPIIQFCLFMDNPDKTNKNNLIVKKSNTIRLSDKILTNNSLYEPDSFPAMSELMQEFEKNNNGLKV